MTAATGTTDRLFGGTGDDQLFGGVGFDQLWGGEGDDFLSGGEGPDILKGDAGNDRLEGGEGDDILDGGEGNDVLLGGAGNDSLEGGTGQVVLKGGDGDDVLKGRGTAILDGGDGNDWLHGIDGAILTGGMGSDTFLAEREADAHDAVTITDFNPNEDILTVSVQEPEDDYPDLSVRIVPWADGTGSDVYLADTLVAKVTGGQDLVPEDVILKVVLRFDDAQAVGGNGNDIFKLYGEQNTVHAGAGDDIIYSTGHLYGEDGDDKITSSSRLGNGSVVFGGNGNDEIQTLHDQDHAYGEAGDDVLSGHGHLDGGAGNDVLTPRSTESVTMTGGTGEDTFVVNVKYTKPTTPHVITDFDPSQDSVTIKNWPPDPQTITIQDWPDGTGADVMVDGTVYVRVHGGAGLTVDDITVRN